MDISQIFKKRRSEIEKIGSCDPLSSVDTSLAIADFLGDLSKLNCEQKCPLDEVSMLELSDDEKSFGFMAFKNFTEFEGILKKGQCRGHTIMTQKFNSLGVYCHKSNMNCGNVESFTCRRKRVCDSDPLFESGKDCHPDRLTNHCKKFFKQLIRDISMGKMRAIPGYSSLAEFSAQATFMGDFKREIKKYHSKFTATKAQIEQKTASPLLNTFLEVEKRVQRNFTPYLGIKGAPGSGLGNHAISVYKIEQDDSGSKKLCVRDSNAPRVTRDKKIIANKCQNYLYQVNDSIFYYRHGKVSNKVVKMNMYGDEDKRTMQYAREYQNVCERIKSREKSCITDGVSNNQFFKL